MNEEPCRIQVKMRYYLSDNHVLKWLEMPALYDLKKDELYELDGEAFEFLKTCASVGGCEAGQIDEEFLNFCLSEGILKTIPYRSKTTPILKSPTPSLRYLELQITDKCNLKCKHCFVGFPRNIELQVDDIRKVLDEFLEMQGLRVMITGGEPLMHSMFEQINSMLSDYNLRKVLFTNGLMLNNKILKSLNFDEIQFSIDGMAEGHDALRGKGTYKKAIKNLNKALEMGIPTSVATVVHSKNLDEFEKMEELFKRLGIKDWTVDVPSLTGSLKENSSFQIAPDIAGRYLNYGFGENYHSCAEGFACGLHLCSVLANGAIAKCAFYSAAPLGNIDEGLRKSWQMLKPLRLEWLECSDISCPVINSCRGGCRYRATVSDKNGGEYKRDIYKCYAYGIIKNEDRA